MTNLQTMLVGKAARYTAPATWRLWIKGMLKSVVHNFTGTLITSISTNGLGIGLSFWQSLAQFGSQAAVAALVYVHFNTAPGGTQPPFQS